MLQLPSTWFGLTIETYNYQYNTEENCRRDKQNRAEYQYKALNTGPSIVKKLRSNRNRSFWNLAQPKYIVLIKA